ncbi:MAG TPA: N-acetyl-D-Glu racemase DgcA [Chthoniobacteraceae bacterium]|nr:N-acetyl-D-Glu racemase DgcA [Chthoniobacteraceae bacterium]
MKITATTETWKLAQAFTISRGSRMTTEVVVVTLEGEGHTGRGEATPLARYGESPASALEQLAAVAPRLQNGEPLEALLESMPPGAARNALDCAGWDWRCKQASRRIDQLLGWPPLRPVTTAYTLSIDTPEAMEAAARKHAARPLLKIKLGPRQVIESVEAVRRGAPASRLIVDANEAWDAENLPRYLGAMADLGVGFVEQPLPAGRDDALARIERPLPVLADEAFHTTADLPGLIGKYDGINIKLDKTGGLTEALRAVAAGREAGMRLMCGCMLGTSLAMAPAMVVAQQVDEVDLDAPLLLADDRPEGLRFHGSTIEPFSGRLWG